MNNYTLNDIINSKVIIAQETSENGYNNITLVFENGLVLYVNYEDYGGSHEVRKVLEEV